MGKVSPVLLSMPLPLSSRKINYLEAYGGRLSYIFLFFGINEMIFKTRLYLLRIHSIFKGYREQLLCIFRPVQYLDVLCPQLVCVNWGPLKKSHFPTGLQVLFSCLPLPCPTFFPLFASTATSFPSLWFLSHSIPHLSATASFSCFSCSVLKKHTSSMELLSNSIMLTISSHYLKQHLFLKV